MDFNCKKDWLIFVLFSFFGAAVLFLSFLGFSIAAPYMTYFKLKAIAIFNLDILVVTVYFMLYFYLLFFNKKILRLRLYLSSFISLIWMFIAKDQYGYNQNWLSVFGFNLFPLFAWALGLFIVYFLYDYIDKKWFKTKLFVKITLFFVFYSSLLLFAETIAYHLFNIRNLAASMYAGLPLCDCLHAPLWMQVSYFALGLIYYLLCKLSSNFIKKHLIS